MRGKQSVVSVIYEIIKHCGSPGTGNGIGVNDIVNGLVVKHAHQQTTATPRKARKAQSSPPTAESARKLAEALS